MSGSTPTRFWSTAALTRCQIHRIGMPCSSGLKFGARLTWQRVHGGLCVPGHQTGCPGPAAERRDVVLRPRVQLVLRAPLTRSTLPVYLSLANGVCRSVNCLFAACTPPPRMPPSSRTPCATPRRRARGTPAKNATARKKSEPGG